jgi:hypothetical protein
VFTQDVIDTWIDYKRVNELDQIRHDRIGASDQSKEARCAQNHTHIRPRHGDDA